MSLLGPFMPSFWLHLTQRLNYLLIASGLMHYWKSRCHSLHSTKAYELRRGEEIIIMVSLHFWGEVPLFQMCRIVSTVLYTQWYQQVTCGGLSSPHVNWQNRIKGNTIKEVEHVLIVPILVPKPFLRFWTYLPSQIRFWIILRLLLSIPF